MRQNWFMSDKRPQYGSWAPGNYCCTCRYCKEYFFGDKRAMVCADCTYGKVETEQSHVNGEVTHD